MDKNWWKEAFGYQIYLRSFFDGNNDGIGDLPGIIAKLPYLAHLGVNLLWICPFYTSPMDDNGYDVANFYRVAREYGTLKDLRSLIKSAHQLQMKVIIDLVLNHTSDEHPWFKASRKSLNNPYRDYYIWKKPRIIDGQQTEPTNWASFFGGSCWEFDVRTQEYYMKIFSKKMPDLNWENPKVQEEMVQMATWWCEQGIDGFRIDAISHLAKAEFVDSDLFPDHEYKPDWSKYSNLPRLHDYLKLLNKRVFSKYNIVTIGEVGGNAPVSEGIAYTNPKNHELNMVFNFDHNWCNNAWGAQSKKELSTDVQQLKAVFHKWQTGLYGQGWNAIYWLNHDQPRLMSQYGDPEHYHQESAKMLATVLYFMGGTPFIYNGEEIGMTNPEFKSIADFRDVSIINQYEINVKRHHQDEQAFLARAALTSRDNARSLMQWSDQADGGFSLVKPWNIIGDYHKINVAKQINDPQSIFTYYRRIIALRKSDQYRDVLVYGTYEGLWMEHPDLFAYMRSYAHQRLLVIANMTKKTVALPSIPYQQVKIILANYEGRQLSPALLPYEAMLIQIEEED